MLAGAGFALWLGLSWVQDHLLSPSGFQDTAASSVLETSFQEDLVTTVLDRVTPDALEQAHTGIGPVDDAVQRLRSSVQDGVRSWLTSTGQQGTWLRILNDTHDANIPLTPAAGHAPENFVVDASALGEAVDHKVQDTLGVSPGLDRQQLVVTIPGVRTGAVVDRLVQLAQWRYVLPWMAGALALLTVVLAPRRWLGLAGTGLAAVVCAGILLGTGLGAARTVVGASAADPVAHLVTEQVVGVLEHSFTEHVVTGMIAAGVVALAGVVGAVVRVRTVTYDGGHVHRG